MAKSNKANVNNMKKKLGLLLMLVAIGLLIPGVTQPIMTLTGTVDKSELADLGMQILSESPDVPQFMASLVEQLVSQLDVRGEVAAYDKTRSITGTIQELYDARQYLVAFLIALFSIVVPLSKCLLMIITAIAQNRFGRVCESITRVISKWSMADVYVVGIIVAYLAANATQQTEKLFTFNAEFGVGFYYFLGYCLLSILSAQLMDGSSRSVLVEKP